ncbi:MAG: Gfo/Idh/MocA family protein [bacterium]
MSETVNKPVNLAFLGCGFATRLHSKTLSGWRDKVQCFYASRETSRAAAYNQKYQGHGTFDGYDTALQAQEIDAVLVATPPAHHLELTLKALSAGKHVIVEKPPFLHSRDFDTVQKAANKAGKRIFVAENYYYKPLLFKLRELVHSNVIGEILFVHINALKKQEIKDWRGDQSLAGGGALFEGGIHWVNFISNLGLQLESVTGFRPGPAKGMDQSMLLALRYQEGAVGSFYYSWETPSLFKGLRISKLYGREGSITFESNGIFVLVRGRRKQIIFPGLKDIAGYKHMFQDYLSAIQEDRDPAFTLNLAKRDLETIEQAYEASDT